MNPRRTDASLAFPCPPLCYRIDEDRQRSSPVLFAEAVSLWGVYILGSGSVLRSNAHRSGHLPPSLGAKVLCLAGQQSQASAPGRSSAVGADACPSARVDPFAPVPSGRTKRATVSWQRSPTRQPSSSGRVRRWPGWSGQPGTCRSHDSRRWTTGEPPSCPGWTELVRSGGG